MLAPGASGRPAAGLEQGFEDSARPPHHHHPTRLVLQASELLRQHESSSKKKQLADNSSFINKKSDPIPVPLIRVLHDDDQKEEAFSDPEEEDEDEDEFGVAVSVVPQQQQQRQEDDVPRRKSSSSNFLSPFGLGRWRTTIRRRRSKTPSANSTSGDENLRNSHSSNEETGYNSISRNSNSSSIDRNRKSSTDRKSNRISNSSSDRRNNRISNSSIEETPKVDFTIGSPSKRPSIGNTRKISATYRKLSILSYTGSKRLTSISTSPPQQKPSIDSYGIFKSVAEKNSNLAPNSTTPATTPSIPIKPAIRRPSSTSPADRTSQSIDQSSTIDNQFLSVNRYNDFEHRRRRISTDRSQQSVRFQLAVESTDDERQSIRTVSTSSTHSGRSAADIFASLRIPGRRRSSSKKHSFSTSPRDLLAGRSPPNANSNFARIRDTSISLFRNSSRIFQRNRMASSSTVPHNLVDQQVDQQQQKRPSLAVETTSPNFLRTDSLMIRVKPGDHFSQYSNVCVEPPTKSDPRLGTFGELRHQLQTGTKEQVKRFLRQNNWTSGHRIRAELWKELCHDKNSDAQRAVYRDTMEKLGAIQTTRPTFLTVPGVVLCDHQLKENGRNCLLRLLTAVEHHRPDFTYVPVLYPLGALFLHYMDEEEAFACIMNLISQSQKFLLQTDIATTASKRTMLVLIKKHVKNAYISCKRLTNLQDDKDLVAIFDDWKTWIFRDLPFSHLVRIVDCFLFEGQKVLFRVALALVNLWYEDRGKKIRPAGKIWTAKEMGEDIADYCRTINVQPPKLLKAAFGVRNLKMSTVSRLQQKHEMNLRHSVSGAGDLGLSKNAKEQVPSHNFIDVQLDSNILDHNQAMQVISWIPSRYQVQTPSKLFSSDEDGTSFTRLWTKLESLEPTILVIKTSMGDVFGAYCSTAWDTWKRGSGVSYFGTGETFLFRFAGPADTHGEKFIWVGKKKPSVTHSEELFQAADLTTLVVGGGNDEAISIRQSLESGSCGRSLTFDNPMLSSKRDFDIQTLEVFAFLSE